MRLCCCWYKGNKQAMLLTACGNKETDSGGGKTETETETPVADDQQTESEETEEVTTEEEDAVEGTEDSSAESETHEPYTADDVTDSSPNITYCLIWFHSFHMDHPVQFNPNPQFLSLNFLIGLVPKFFPCCHFIYTIEGSLIIQHRIPPLCYSDIPEDR